MILISHTNNTHLNLFKKKVFQIYTCWAILYYTAPPRLCGSGFIYPSPPSGYSGCSRVRPFRALQQLVLMFSGRLSQTFQICSWSGCRWCWCWVLRFAVTVAASVWSRVRSRGLVAWSGHLVMLPVTVAITVTVRLFASGCRATGCFSVIR